VVLKIEVRWNVDAVLFGEWFLTFQSIMVPLKHWNNQPNDIPSHRKNFYLS
jgi:hypothetical protein